MGHGWVFFHLFLFFLQCHAAEFVRRDLLEVTLQTDSHLKKNIPHHHYPPPREDPRPTDRPVPLDELSVELQPQPPPDSLPWEPLAVAEKHKRHEIVWEGKTGGSDEVRDSCKNKQQHQQQFEKKGPALLEQAWANYGAGAMCGPVSFLICPAELETISINLMF